MNNKNLYNTTTTIFDPYGMANAGNSSVYANTSTTAGPMRTELNQMLLENRVVALETKLFNQSLMILKLLNKFTDDELNNIKNMYYSNDDASVELAKTIIEESLCQ